MSPLLRALRFLAWVVPRRVALEPDPINRMRLEQHFALDGAMDVVVLPFKATSPHVSGFVNSQLRMAHTHATEWRIISS